MSVRRTTSLWLASAVILIMFALGVSSMAQKAPTFDEQGFLVRGLGYLRGENDHMRVGHPLGLNALNALFLVNDESVALPLDDPSWQATSFHRPAELFLWEIGNDVEHVMFLARLPTLFLALLLAALAGRWAWMLTRRRAAGLVALLLLALDPNVLASARLTTTDLGLALGACVAGLTLWWFLSRPRFSTAILAGIGFGLLQNTKFTAGLFVPLFALVILVGIGTQWQARRRASDARAFPWGMVLLLATVYPLTAFLTLWVAYGFQIGTLPQDLPTLPQLGGLTLPLSHHLEQLLDIGGRLQVSTPSFLAGQYSDSGWWFYFPVAFLLKTPLPSLILLGWAAGVTLWRLFKRERGSLSLLDQAALLIPGLGYFAIALATDINLGYRHLLPVLPFLWVWTATSLPLRWPQGASARAWVRQPAVWLLAWLAVATLWIYPDFLAFFNLLAGGPENGWRMLADSNIDWGQDLNQLDDWMAEQGVDEVWLSYFGEARPSAYGIAFQGLDSFPPRLMNPAARPFLPDNPAPGVYAISVTNLLGVQFADHDLFAWFREREPLDKLGYSLFLYEVEPTGEPAALVLGGVQPDELPAGATAEIGSNQLAMRWVNPAEALLLPQSQPAWAVVGEGQAVAPALASFWPDEAMTVAPISAEIELPPALTTLSLGEGAVDLIGAELVADENGALTLMTTWQNSAEPQPIKLFVHATSGDNPAPYAQWDGLGVAWEGWRSQDVVLQLHELTWPEEEPRPDTRLWIGAYDPTTGDRWISAEGEDRVELSLD